MNPYFHIINDTKEDEKMYKLSNIKHKIVLGCLCMIMVGCSYTPYRYSFSLIEPQNKTMNFEDDNVQFRFIPSPENIRVAIRNKTDHDINFVRDNTEFIDSLGESRRIHYGYDYVQEVRNFEDNDLYVPPMRIEPDSEIAGYVWLNNWPDFRAGPGPGTEPVLSYRIYYLMEPLFPRYSFEGSGEELRDSTFNLILPIDFGGYVRNYTFTFMINDVV
ncbi:MAG: hypothetical protein SCARUB_01310 [Candidatus Scalindua rubra]|uniref:Uncharacterized protein n=1 Tax=Candidatus Scalindua rubra TaxID=1872076 RepID=A0A1E3XD69_9BACT|nr:MAG: hypothetical protein SCARUB_01310 [Candidatus Scalindua rubra]